MKFVCALVLLLCFLSGCGRSTDLTATDMTAEDCLRAGYVCVRVRNSSEFDFGRFSVHFPSHIEEFGSVGAGETSVYRRTDAAYRYAYTEAFSGIRKFVLQPIDFVGERYLLPGIYTYDYSAEAHKTISRGWLFSGQMGVVLNNDEDGN